MAMNLIIYPIGIIGFWLTGYAFMMGGVAHWPFAGVAAQSRIASCRLRSGAHSYGILGFSKFAAAQREPRSRRASRCFSSRWFFMDTAATIPTGAMAERWKFKAFFVYGLFMSMFLYPLYAKLGCGAADGFSQLGVKPSGSGMAISILRESTVVHMTGGVNRTCPART